MTNPGSVMTSQVTEWMREESVTEKEFQFFEDEEHFHESRQQRPLDPIVCSIPLKRKMPELP